MPTSATWKSTHRAVPFGNWRSVIAGLWQYAPTAVLCFSNGPTGDADVAYLAGARCSKSDKKDMQGVTTVFSCSGVDKAKFLEYTESNPAT